MGLATDDGDHERKAEGAGAGERCGSSAYAEPDGERVLERTGEDALPGERGAMFAGPGDVGGVADLEKEIQILGEERVVVFEVESEEGEGFDEGAAAGDDLRATVGEEVEGGELLEDADGVGGREDGDGAGETDVFGARGGCGENDGGSGVEEFGTMMLAYPEGVEAYFVRERNLFDEVLQAESWCRGDVGYGVGDECGEAVNTDLHGSLQDKVSAALMFSMLGS